MYTLKRRVHFYETDGMRVVYHGNYLRWMEEARVEYLREGDVDLNDLMRDGIVFPIVEVNIKYIRSARYDDIVLVKTWLRKMDRAKMVFEYEMYRESDGELLTKAMTVGTYTSMKTGRIVRLPKEKLTKLEALSEGDRNNG